MSCLLLFFPRLFWLIFYILLEATETAPVSFFMIWPVNLNTLNFR